MIYKYSKRILLMLMITMCFGLYSTAQESIKDSLPARQEVVKNIAYGTQPAWMVTGAISTVTGTELEHSFTSNLANTLNGRLAGLTVGQGSGEPGSDAPTLNGRGLNTYGTGNALLIMVDGYETTFGQLVPEEIESVVLLKDASATAIYGSRGGNGVLLVTTKRGKDGALQVNFSTRQGFQTAPRLPKMLGSYDYARLYNEALKNDGKPARYSDQDLDAYRTGTDPFFHPSVNWYDQVLRKSAPISNYDLNFSGGNNSVKYFVLLNALKNNGLYVKTGDLSDNSKNPSYAQYNFRTNVDIQVTKRFAASFTLGGSVVDKNTPAGNNTSSMFNLMSSIPPNAFPVYNPDHSFGGNALYSNPLGDALESGYSTSNGRTLQATLRLSEQLDMITQGLSISGAVSFNNYFMGYSNRTRQYIRYSISRSANVPPDTMYTGFGQKTSLTDDESQSDQWHNLVFQTFLNYNRSFGRHNIAAMLMYNSDAYTITGDSLPFKHVGAGGRFTYTYNDKYVGEFSFGYDGSENFPKGHRFGFFPAVSLGWIASNEQFLKGNSILNFMKIRASYGMVGNDNIGGQRFMFDQYYSNSNGYYFGSSNTYNGGISETSIANPNVTWEKQKQINFGAELTLWKHLDFTLDVFKQDRTNILSIPNGTIPQYLGLNLPDLNVGKASNKGFEIGVQYNSDRDRSFQYFVGANAWYAKNKIVYNSEPGLLYDYLYRTGKSIGQPFVLEAIGFFKDQADVDASPQQIFSTVQPGDVKYKDENNDGIVDQNDQVAIGNATLPQLTLGVQGGISYRNFDLNVMLQAVSGRTVYLGGNYFEAFQNNGTVSSIALGRWTPETAAGADYPRLSASNNLNNFQPSSLWQRNGSFIKLRSLELGYTLKGNFIKRIGAGQARVFIIGTNLFSIDHMDGLADPETINGYPATRTLGAGIKIQL